MKVPEITEGWGDSLKSLAGGFVRGATGTSELKGKNWHGVTNAADVYAKDFVRRTGAELIKAIAGGGVDTDPAAPMKPVNLSWTWTDTGTAGAGNGVFKSGNTGTEYRRTMAPGAGGSAVATWASITPPVNYGSNTSHAKGLEKKYQDYVSKEADTAAGEMPDLSEAAAKFNKLASIFESIIREAAMKESIASALLKLIRINIGLARPLDAAGDAAVEQQCLVVQRNYSDHDKFNKEMFNLGKLLYSLIMKKPGTP